MKKVRHFMVVISFAILVCGCGKAKAQPEVSVSSIEASAESAVTDISESEESVPEAIQAILNVTKTEPNEYDESIAYDVDYYTRLVQEMYGLPYWKAYGVASLVINHNPGLADAMVIRFIDGGVAPEGFESLFEGFFLDRYSDSETIQYAKAYAYYLTKYILDNYSFAEFADNNYREEWLKAKGSKSEYVYDDIDELMEEATITKDRTQYTITVGEHDWICGNETWVKDAGELYSVIHTSERDVRRLREELKADAPEWFENVASKRTVKFTLFEAEDASFTHLSSDGVETIFLGHNTFAATHEYVHALSYTTTDPNMAWLVEGAAVRYSMKYLADLGFYDSKFEDVLNGASLDDYLAEIKAENSDEWPAYTEAVRAKYNVLKEKHGDKYVDRVYRYIAEAQTELERGEPFNGDTIADGYYEANENYVGNGALTDIYKNSIESKLTYGGAYVATDLLIQKFGADKVLTYLGNGDDFEGEFGCTIQEFLDEIRKSGSYNDAFIYEP